MSAWSLLSAGRRISVGFVGFLTVSLLIAHGTCLPLTEIRPHIHHLHARAPQGSASTAQSEASGSNSDDNDSVLSSKNSFFPAIVVVVAASAVILLFALCLYIRYFWKKRSSAEDTDTHSVCTMPEKFAVPEEDVPSLPRPRPVASSVARGSSSRFKGLSGWTSPFQAGADFTDKSVCPAPTSRSMNKSQRDSVYSDYASTFSLDSKGSAEASCFRQTDLSQPCVTHGSPNWIIQAYENENDADVSYTQVAYAR